MGTSVPTMSFQEYNYLILPMTRQGQEWKQIGWLSILQDCSTGEGGRQCGPEVGPGSGVSASPEGSGPLLGGDLPYEGHWLRASGIYVKRALPGDKE